MLRYTLLFQRVVLPNHPAIWPAPLDFQLGLKEFLLIEGVGLEESEPLLGVAATVHRPVEGQVLYWGEDVDHLTWPELYELRRHIAYISSRQVLLHRLTLAENFTLGPSYHEGLSSSQALKEHAALIELFHLEPHLDLFPPQLSAEVYYRAIWVRDLIQKPELILAVLEDLPGAAETQEMVLKLLQDFLHLPAHSVILAGRSLEKFRPLAHRLIRPESGHLKEYRFLENQGRPLVSFLPLV